MLVLVNGKRRHNSALVNVNGSVGRGSTGVDLNAIPLSAIDHIEILRDGAAAQYGSDAIAGVINIVLKSEPRADGSFQTGQTYAGDGDFYQVGGSKGVGSASGSFFNLAGDFHHRDYTNRANVDTVSPFFAGDLRNTDPQYRNVLRWRHGDALVNEGMATYNAGTSFANGIQFYSFGGGSLRKEIRRQTSAARTTTAPSARSTLTASSRTSTARFSTCPSPVDSRGCGATGTGISALSMARTASAST